MIFCGVGDAAIAGLKASLYSQNLQELTDLNLGPVIYFHERRRLVPVSRRLPFRFKFYRPYFNLLQMLISRYLQVTLTSKFHQYYIIKMKNKCYDFDFHYLNRVKFMVQNY